MPVKRGPHFPMTQEQHKCDQLEFVLLLRNIIFHLSIYIQPSLLLSAWCAGLVHVLVTPVCVHNTMCLLPVLVWESFYLLLCRALCSSINSLDRSHSGLHLYCALITPGLTQWCATQIWIWLLITNVATSSCSKQC